MPENLKIIIGNKAFDVDGYSVSRQEYVLLDGRRVGFEQVRQCLRGTGVEEYQYNRFEPVREIFEGDKIKFFDDRNNIITGVVFWSLRRLQWMIVCDKNPLNWVEYRLCDAGLPSILGQGTEGVGHQWKRTLIF